MSKHLFALFIWSITLAFTAGFSEHDPVCRGLTGNAREVFLPWMEAVVKEGQSSRKKPKQKAYSYIEAVSTVSLMTKISYTGNVSEPVKSWALIKALTPKDGLNAVVYLTHSLQDKSAIVIAFRGTTTASDRCADIVLWEPEKRLPLWCDIFPKPMLNYTARALDLVGEIKSQYPNIPILFTGHSLGAALAQMMSSASNGSSPALCFASGGAKGPSIRMNLYTSKSDLTCSVQIYNEWDPIVHFSIKEQFGFMCVYQNVTEPEACKDCLKSHNMANLACEKCFEQAHKYSNYLDLLDGKHIPTCVMKTENRINNRPAFKEEIIYN